MDIRQRLMISPLYDWLGKRSFAQSGEDLIVWGELTTPMGFYVDVGAYHPKLFSNTYLFYKKGWNGICIEPNPEMEKLFRWSRPRDVFLNMGVGRGNAKNKDDVLAMEYLIFDDGATNTFSPEQAKKNQDEAGRRLVGKRKIPVSSLESIFEKHLPKGQKIDLLSVDVEGMDEEVLQSNDWKKYRPTMIIAEDLSFDFDQPRKSGVVKYLGEVGYQLTAKTPYSLIFKQI